MKRIAFISDIHSNLPALEATLENIRLKGITDIYCLGDIIGYHSNTNEVVSLLRESSVVSIMGNHDMVITQENFDRNEKNNFVLTWNLDVLTDENRNYLSALPLSMDIDIDDVKVKIVHGSPESIDEYIREGSDTADYYLNRMETDVLISGHTHLPYIMERNGKYLLNTGSVGKPKFGKPECSYIVLAVEGSEINPEIITLPYDVERITKDLKDKQFPEKLILALESGNP